MYSPKRSVANHMVSHHSDILENIVAVRLHGYRMVLNLPPVLYVHVVAFDNFKKFVRYLRQKS